MPVQFQFSPEHAAAVYTYSDPFTTQELNEAIHEGQAIIDSNPGKVHLIHDLSTVRQLPNHMISYCRNKAREAKSPRHIGAVIIVTRSAFVNSAFYVISKLLPEFHMTTVATVDEAWSELAHFNLTVY